jgi:uncharacterized membrane protein YeiH
MLLIIIEYLGTFAFAISGIRLASAKQFDLFGAFVVGFATAVGGGTLRDLLLGVTPFWLANPSYLICTAIALVFVIIFSRHLVRLENTFFIFDTIGLGLFVLVGIEKSLALDFPLWVAIIMGMTTGAVGGIIRDIIINEEPLIFRKEIYASACIIGGLIFCLLNFLAVNPLITQIATILGVIFIRIIAVRFKIGLPVLHGEDNFKNNEKSDE